MLVALRVLTEKNGTQKETPVNTMVYTLVSGKLVSKMCIWHLCTHGSFELKWPPKLQIFWGFLKISEVRFIINICVPYQSYFISLLGHGHFWVVYYLIRIYFWNPRAITVYTKKWGKYQASKNKFTLASKLLKNGRAQEDL